MSAPTVKRWLAAGTLELPLPGAGATAAEAHTDAVAVLAELGTQRPAPDQLWAGSAELIARRTRAVVETAVEQTIHRTGRALGPTPLCQDGEHAQRVADLSIYVRQRHAERDLTQLGRQAGARR
jgi:hypothetical protein